MFDYKASDKTSGILMKDTGKEILNPVY